MRRRNRTIEIFSLSAIDLFASTLGAFVIVTAILIPYYPNLKDGGVTLAKLEAMLAGNIEAEAEAEAERAQLEAQLAARQAEAKAAEEKAARQRALDALTRQQRLANEDLEGQLAALEQELAALPDPPEEEETESPQAAGYLSDFSVLGITTEAKRIVILTDLSGSIREEGAEQVLVDTLLEIIEPFHDDISFAILGFQGFGVTQYWPQRGRMAVADALSKADARRFIRQLPAVLVGGTPTRTALVTGLQYKPEAIILISDGEPTDDEGADIVRRITEINGKRVEINTVAIGKYLENNQLINFLNDLAKNNRGQFVGVIGE